ncbi:MAG TPA: TonB-dependent receptor [Bryobacteraceae bacterium]|nr:TonB-dependent receptor [Bryobacteraceae bacterium]
MGTGLVACVLMTPFGVAYAQESPQPGPSPTPAQGSGSSGFQGGDVVVTAQKRTERVVNVPVSIAVKTGRQLQEAGVVDIRELDAVVPGLTFSSQGVWATPAIRGISTSAIPAGGENPVAIYIDGVYVPSETSAGIFDFTDISRVDVLKGPQGTLFGRNASGGAIEIFTLDPSFHFTAQANIADGYYDGAAASNDFSANGFVSGPLIDNVLAGSVSAHYQGDGGYLKSDVNGRREGSIEKSSFRGKLLFEPDSSLRVVAAAYYLHGTDNTVEAGLPLGGVTVGSVYPGALFSTLPWHGNYDSPTTPTDRYTDLGVNITADYNTAVGKFKSISAYDRAYGLISVDIDASYSPACLAAFACAGYQVAMSSYTASEELDFVSNQYGPVNFVAGAYAFYDVDRQSGNADNGAFIYHHQVPTTSYAVFGELNFDVTKKLTLTFGLRENYDNKANFFSLYADPITKYANTSWTNTSPRFSARYSLFDNTNVYFTYSEGFKSGVYSETDPAAPAASPETVDSYEVGLKTSTPQYTFNAALFYYDYKNMQVTTFNQVGAAAVSIVQNAAASTIYGLDVDGSMKISDEFNISGGFVYLPEAKFDKYDHALAYELPLTPTGLSTTFIDASGTRLPHAPTVTANASVNYSKETDVGVVSANISYYYSSAYNWEVTQHVITAAYNTVGARLSFQPKGTRFTVSLVGKNLTGAKSVDSTLVSSTAFLAIYAPPRYVGIDLAFKY